MSSSFQDGAKVLGIKSVSSEHQTSPELPEISRVITWLPIWVEQTKHGVQEIETEAISKQ